LSNDLFECVTLILKFRKEANVPEKYPYIFELPGSNKHRYRYLRACVLRKKFARECNANHSTTLRGTVAVINAYPRELHACRDITRARASSLHMHYDCSKSGNVISKLFNYNLKRVFNILIYSTCDMFDT